MLHIPRAIPLRCNHMPFPPKRAREQANRLNSQPLGKKFDCAKMNATLASLSVIWIRASRVILDNRVCVQTAVSPSPPKFPLSPAPTTFETVGIWNET